jgi:hypothetical protein
MLITTWQLCAAFKVHSYCFQVLGLAEASSLLLSLDMYLSIYIYSLLPTRDIAGQKFISGQDFQVMNKFVSKVASFSLSPLHCIESSQFYLRCLAKL